MLHFWNSNQVLEWATWQGGGVAGPGDVQGTFRCYVEEHGLVTISDGWIVGQDDLVGVSQPW